MPPCPFGATLDDIGVKRQAIDEALGGLREGVTDPRSKELLATLEEAAAAFWKAGAANLALTSAGQKDAASDHLVAILIPKRNHLLAVTGAVRDFEQSRLAGLEARTAEQMGATKRLLVGCLFGVALLLSGLAWSLAASLRRRVAQAGQVAAQIAAGELSTPVPADGRDEFIPLLQQLQQMQHALQNAVGQVRTSSDSIAVASTEIASGNADLSTRTEQTAGTSRKPRAPWNN